MNDITLNLNESEPLKKYDFLMADDGRVALGLPGYFKGEAHDPVLLYNGGEHGVFVRNAHQILVCDFVNEDIREHLMKVSEIYIFEEDAGREYMADFRIEDIDSFAEEVVDKHSFGFTHHPFPLLDGTLRVGKRICEFCGKSGVYYLGEIFPPAPDDEERPRCICTECIANGRATDMVPNLQKHYRVGGDPNKIFMTNPPFFDREKSTSFWGIHCFEPGIYLGELEPEDLNDELKESVIRNWEQLHGWWNDFDPEKVLEDFKEGKIKAYLFRCSECSEVFCSFSVYEKVL